MGRTCLIVATVLVALALFFFNRPVEAMSDDDDLQLKELWKEYRAAESKDLPQKQLAALDKILKESLSRRIPYDYYVAGENKVQVRRRINWKDVDNAREEFRKAVEDYGLPVMELYYRLQRGSGSSVLDYAMEHASELRQSNVTAFSRAWFSTWDGLGSYVGTLVRNDLEFALWACRLNGTHCSDALLAEIGKSYPGYAVLEYLDANQEVNADDRIRALEAHADKYAGKAAAMLSRQQLLKADVKKLSLEKDVAEDWVKSYHAKCQAFEKERKAFSGDERRLADCCVEVRDILDALEVRSARADIEDDTLRICFRNLDKASVELVSRKDGKKVWASTVENPADRFYLQDEAVVILPRIDDGDYDVLVKGKDVNSKSRYSRHTISAAFRQDSRGYAIFAADYKTGEPLDVVDLSFFVDGKETATAKGLAIDGFTPLPDNMVAAIKKANGEGRYRPNYLVCSHVDKTGGIYRCSDRLGARYYSMGEERISESTMAHVLLDRTAFKPGETVQYKAVVYSNKGYDYAPIAGKTVTVSLVDAEGKDVKTVKASTNDFGSIAGSIEIPHGLRNGYFTLRVLDGKNYIGDAGLRVDDFVLPTFDVRFEKIVRFFLEGDTVRIKAWATSYSGHSLASAKVFAHIGRGYRDSDDELDPVTVAPDGSFELVAKDVKYGYCDVIVKVVDNTGETLEFNTSFFVMRRPSVTVEVENAVEASQQNVVDGDVLTVRASIGNELGVKTGNNGDAEIIYRILGDKDKLMGVGSLTLGERLDIGIASLPSGRYALEVEAAAKKADGSVVSDRTSCTFIRISEDETVFDADVESLFRVIEKDDDISLQMASGRGPLWVCVEVFGYGEELLRSEIVKVGGIRGQKGSVVHKHIDYPRSWPDKVVLHVFYFKGGRVGRYSKEISKAAQEVKLPLAVSRFSDVTSPSAKYDVTLATAAGVEAAASIFDAATEVIFPNCWYEVYRMRPSLPYISYNSVCGSSSMGSIYDDRFYVDGEMAENGMYMSKASVNLAVRDMAPRAMGKVNTMSSGIIEEEAFEMMEDDGGDEPEVAGVLREDFANTVAFEPFLRPDKDGKISFEFTTSDKLSTYIINVFAHDKDMNSAVARESFKVTIPVKLSVVEPQLLYVGDKYVLKANLSNSSVLPVDGKVSAYVYTTEKHENASPVAAMSRAVKVEANGAAGVEFEIDVPQAEVLGLKLVFSGNEGGAAISDGVFVSVPVKRPSQTIRESHSSIVFAGQDRDAIVAHLRSLFVNVPAESAVLSERTIMDLIREAIPEKISTEAKDVISLTESLYASVIARTLGMEKLDDGMLDKILACRNADGGFGWFEGMDSSPVVTAAVLKRAAALEDSGLSLGLDDDVLESAVKYIDTQMLKDRKRPSWCGGMSLEQYLLVRAHYADVKLAAQPSAEYRKAVSQYLVPKNGRGVNGAILMKAYRIRTLSLLTASDEGLRLARALGVRLSAEKKMQRSLEADVASLIEYAVEHRSGGKYFPNAVMPFRGLMESELQAHALLCDIFRDFGYEELADAIRIWIMVQKETQQWDVDPAYMEALSSVMDGSGAMKDMRVLILSGENELPFQQIRSAGNGFKVEVLYKREDGSALKSGDVLSVGDKVVSEVRIWNEENRSFVHVCVPRPASLRPENQLSGMMRWWLRPLFVDGWYSCTPQGYRNVKASMTEYFFDSYPEETTTVSETFYVTQAGSFAAPVASIECLYAPHYVANSEYTGELQSR
ncbi:MAG: MG2 domain-containing protein [Bacteroidales bacterium]|nr:MG2 domain-containing protein [Bacteroidales bacterium]